VFKPIRALVTLRRTIQRAPATSLSSFIETMVHAPSS